MGASGMVKIKVLGDISGLNKSLDDAGGKLGGFGSTVGKVAGVLGGLMVVDKIADGLRNCASAAAEDEQSSSRLANTLKNVVGATDAQIAATEAYILKTELAAGVADDKLRPAYQNLVVSLKDSGAAQAAMTVAMDVAQAKGLDLETVTKAMAKAHDGNTGALAKLGIATKDAEGNTLSYDQVLKTLGETYAGSVTANANTAIGAQERMKVAFAEVKEGLGAALLPVIQKFTDFIMANMPAIQSIMEGFGKVVGVVLNVLSEVVFPLLQTVFDSFTKDVSDKTPGTNALFEGMGAVAQGLQSVFQAVWPAIQSLVKMFVDFFAGPTGQALIKGLMEALGAALGLLGDVFRSIWPVIQRVVQTFIDFFNSPTGQKLIKGLLDGIKVAIETLRTVWDVAWKAVGPILEVAWAIIKPILGLMLKALTGVIEAIKWLSTVGVPTVQDAANKMAENIKSQQDLVNAYKDLAAGGGGYMPSTAHALGGVFTTPHIGLVAESGPEAIIPLNNPRRAAQVMEQAGLRGTTTGGTTITGGITINITGQGAAAGEAAGNAFISRLAAAGVRF